MAHGPGSTDNKAVDQQHDAPDALRRERVPSDRMRMPHERDESAGANRQGEKSYTQREVIGQAHDDLASGQQDTDCRNHAPGQRDCPPRAAGTRSEHDTGTEPGARERAGRVSRDGDSTRRRR